MLTERPSDETRVECFLVTLRASPSGPATPRPVNSSRKQETAAAFCSHLLSLQTRRDESGSIAREQCSPDPSPPKALQMRSEPMGSAESRALSSPANRSVENVAPPYTLQTDDLTNFPRICLATQGMEYTRLDCNRVLYS